MFAVSGLRDSLRAPQSKVLVLGDVGIVCVCVCV